MSKISDTPKKLTATEKRIIRQKKMGHYFSNLEFVPLFKTWKSMEQKECGFCRKCQSCRKKNAIRERLAKMLIQIVNRRMTHPFFRGYPEVIKSDLEFYALEMITLKLEKFNVNKSENAFAYFTQVITNAFKYTLKTHYRNNNRELPMAMIDKMGDIL